MISGWARVRVADAADVIGGGTPSTSDPANFGDEVPWLTPKDLSTTSARYAAKGQRGLTWRGLDRSSARMLPRGTVLLTTRAPIGYVAVAAADVSTNQGFRSLVLRRGQVPEFWYYLLKHNRALLEAHANGTTFKELAGSTLATLEFDVPSEAEQRAVAEVLGALDDKIDANERLVRVCDELWLMLATLALDEANATGSAVPLTRMATFVNGRAFTKGATGAGRMVVRIAELNSGPGGSTVYNDLDVPDQHLARAGDLLFAWSGSLTVQRWFRDEAIINQHIFKVLPGTGVPIWLVHAHLLRLLDEFRAIAADKATTMGHIQRRHLEVEVPVLAEDALVELDRRCGALWQRALAAERETLALTALRDTLLPPLMSGELRVRVSEEGSADAEPAAV